MEGYLTTVLTTFPESQSYAAALESLLSRSLLTVTTAVSQLSPIDRLMQLEVEERATIKGIPSAKQLREVQEKARLRLKEEDEKIEQVVI